jgi:putative membrane protein
MMYRYGFAGGGPMIGGGWLGWLSIVLFWALLVFAIVMLVAWVVRAMQRDHGSPTYGTHGSGSVPPTHDEAVAIARRRFAAGEITKEQFDEIMKTLS